MFDLVHVANRKKQRKFSKKKSCGTSQNFSECPTIAYQLGATLKLGCWDD